MSLIALSEWLDTSLLVLSPLEWVDDFLDLGSIILSDSDLWYFSAGVAVKILVDQSANRLLAIYQGFFFALEYPFGGGVGFWQQNSIASLELTGIEPLDYRYFVFALEEYGSFRFRAGGFMGNLLFDVGFFGVLWFIYAFVKELKVFSYLAIREIIFRKYFIFCLINVSIFPLPAQIEHMKCISKHILFNVIVQWWVCHETWALVDFNEPSFFVFVKKDVHSEDLEA